MSNHKKQGIKSPCDNIMGYRGEIIVPLHNHSREHRILHAGDRIAQLIILPYPEIQFEKVDNLSPTSRDEGGFGSTGGYCENRI